MSSDLAAKAIITSRSQQITQVMQTLERDSCSGSGFFAIATESCNLLAQRLDSGGVPPRDSHRQCKFQFLQL
ncbi:MAG: hypothetical protein ACK56I_01440, partial [bacterium]